jgi:hypothetical protein
MLRRSYLAGSHQRKKRHGCCPDGIEIVLLLPAKMLRPLPEKIADENGNALRNERDCENDQGVIDMRGHGQVSSRGAGFGLLTAYGLTALLMPCQTRSFNATSVGGGTVVGGCDLLAPSTTRVAT